VPHSVKLDQTIGLGQEVNEPRCLVEGARRIVDRDVQLHFQRVTSRTS